MAGSIGLYTPRDKNGAIAPGGCWPKDYAEEVRQWEKTAEVFILNQVPYLFLEMIKDFRHAGACIEGLGNMIKKHGYDGKVYLGVSVARESPSIGFIPDREDFEVTMKEPLVFRMTHSSQVEERFVPFDGKAVRKR